MICSAMRAGDRPVPRCNLSSWYVEPAFRTYAPLLVSQAMRHKDVTYMNVSAAPHTWPIIEAQGFARYSEGIFVCLPALQRTPDRSRSWARIRRRQPPSMRSSGKSCCSMPNTAAPACGS